MCAVYAFARRVDDIGDGDARARTASSSCSTTQERALAALSPEAGAQAGADPVMVALADARTRFPLPVDALGELIEGVRMDVRGTTYETFEELVPYCRRVAGTIGRLCLAIFGLRDASARLARADGPRRRARRRAAAHEHPARRARGRRRRAHLPSCRGAAPVRPARAATRPRWPRPSAAAAGPEAVRREAFVRARRASRRRAPASGSTRGMALAPLLDRRSAACLLAMAGIYRRLLERIDADPAAILAGRVSLPAREKALRRRPRACSGSGA